MGVSSTSASSCTQPSPRDPPPVASSRSGTPLGRLLDGPLMLVYTICAAILIGAVILFGRTARMGLKDAAFGAVVGVYPNAGFMGIPLLVVLFGEVGVRVIILTMLVDLFLVISCCLAIVQMP